MEQNMFVLQDIPQWMEQFIPVLTEGGYQTKEELIHRMDNLMKWETATMVMTNQRINLLKSLKEAGLLKVSVMKPITEVQMGEIFKVYPGQDRVYTLDSTKIEDDNGSSYVAIREYQGGKGFHMSSTWLSPADRCHADIEVEVIPSIPEKLLR